MERIAQGQQAHGGDAACRRDFDIAEHGVGTEREGDRGGDQRGGAEIVRLAGFEPGKGDERRHETCKDQPQSDAAGEAGQRAADATKQAGQRKGTQARDPRLIRLISVLPAALEPDQKPDRESYGEAGEDIDEWHERPFRRSVAGDRDGGQCDGYQLGGEGLLTRRCAPTSLPKGEVRRGLGQA